MDNTNNNKTKRPRPVACEIGDELFGKLESYRTAEGLRQGRFISKRVLIEDAVNLLLERIASGSYTPVPGSK